MQQPVTGAGGCGKLVFVAGNPAGNPATYFGKQMRRERVSRGWALTEFAQRIGYDAGHLSRVENGKRPATEALARACDVAFPERKGWFAEYYSESSTWAEVPAAFRSWAEHEEKASSVRDWMPSVVTGLLQTEGYARALLSTSPGAGEDTVKSRLAARMERQRRVLARDEPPLVFFVIDEFALYRLVGSAQVMAGQMRHLSAVASLPNVTLQVMPAVAHPGTASGFVIAGDRSAYAEHVAGGFVMTDETVSVVTRLFDSLRAESYRASESLALIDRTANNGRLA